MSITSKELPPLAKSIAKQAEAKIELFYSEAYADAALHDPTGEMDMPYRQEEAARVNDILADKKERRRALEDTTAFAALEFDNSENDLLLKAAFDHLRTLVRARAMDETAPGQRNYYVQEALDKCEESRAKIAEKIEAGELPAENMQSFSDAFATATIKEAPKEWVDIADRLTKQGRVL